MKKRLCLVTAAFSLLLLGACNKDGEITRPESKLPRITLDSETGIYSTKIGKTLTVVPAIENGEDAAYSWTIEGKEVSTEPVFEYVFEQEGRVFVTLRVENRYGAAKKELRIDVADLALPIIFLAVPSSGIDVLAGREYTFRPDVQNDAEARFEWYLGNTETPVSTNRDYTFMQTVQGPYDLLLRTSNEDGTDEKRIRVNVVNTIGVEITFIPSSYHADPLDRNVSLGRTIYLRPYVEHAVGAAYSWFVDDREQIGQTDRMFAFKPQKTGEYTVRFRVTDTDGNSPKSLSRSITRSSETRITEKTLKVTCYESESSRTIVTTGQAASDRVIEFLPAPGQFVNEKEMAGYGGEKTFEEARAYAEKRLKGDDFVSLGGFGGYIILGFDHSIENKGGHEGYDFSIAGNQFNESNEPGIVWVMQDVNGNGKPDDEWYELRGSETGKEWTVQEYAATYYKPTARRQPVHWTDNRGGSGRIAYMAQFHPQDTYYPLWLEDETYTYYGTCLRQNTSQDPGGDWTNNSFDWGYADNKGSDNLDVSQEGCKTYFKISNAMTLAGEPADLRYIDFVKVQSAVNGTAGTLGENSTEVVGMAVDENIGSNGK